jgi:protein transport protein SEC61 subunit gamma and related proteins
MWMLLMKRPEPPVVHQTPSTEPFKSHTHTHNTEFARIAYATSVGFLIMGFIGFFVKLIHIPINNILLGGF